MKFSDIVSSNYQSLSQTDKQLCRFLLDHAKLIENMTCEETAVQAYTSKATLSRLAKKLGFRGFNELKISVMNNDNHFDIDIVSASLAEFLQIYIDENVIKFNSIFSLIEQANKIFICYTGFHQKKLAEILQEILIKYGVTSNLFGTQETTTNESIIKHIKKDNLIFVFSHSGSSNELCKLMDQLMICNAKFISITQSKTCKLAQKADIAIYFNNCIPEEYSYQFYSGFNMILLNYFNIFLKNKDS